MDYQGPCSRSVVGVVRTNKSREFRELLIGILWSGQAIHIFPGTVFKKKGCNDF